MMFKEEESRRALKLVMAAAAAKPSLFGGSSPPITTDETPRTFFHHEFPCVALSKSARSRLFQEAIESNMDSAGRTAAVIAQSRLLESQPPREAAFTLRKGDQEVLVLEEGTEKGRMFRTDQETWRSPSGSEETSQLYTFIPGELNVTVKMNHIVHVKSHSP
jgi:hypothetical protein